MGVDENNYEEKKMGVGQIVDKNSDKKRWVYSTVQQQQQQQQQQKVYLYTPISESNEVE